MARYDIYNGIISSGLTLSSGTSMYISSGGTANYTTFSGYSAYMYLSSGGIANNTIVNMGNMYISRGGMANSTCVGDNGYMYVSSGGVANNTTVNSYGNMFIRSGGTATNIIWTPCVGSIYIDNGAYVTYASDYSGVYIGYNNQLRSHTQSISSKNIYGQMYVMNNGIAVDTIVGSSGYSYISSGGTVYGTSVDEGYMYIYSGGVANSTTVSGNIYTDGYVNYNRCGYVRISSGGVANNTYVRYNGCMYVSFGGTANSTYVSYSGYMAISSGGMHRGILHIGSKGATVSAYSGSIIDFTVVGRNADDGYLINNLSLIQGAPTYTVSVDEYLADATYKLAQGANDFSGTLTIGDGINDYGLITVNGDDFVYKNITYSLEQKNGDLTLTIKKDVTPPNLTIYGNATTPTNQDINLTVCADEACTILYSIDNNEWQTYSNGISVSSNGTIYIKATDAVGNVTKKSVVVDKIDKKAPVFQKIILSSEHYTFDDPITVMLEISDINDFTIYYRIDNDDLQKLSGSSITVYEVSHITFIAIDAAGNSSTQSVYAKAGYVPVSSGATSSGLQVSKGFLDILPGGIAIDTNVYSGGTVENSGLVSGLNASSGARLYGDGLWILTTDTKIARDVAGQTRDQQFVSSRTFMGFSNFVVDSGLNWQLGSAFEMKETHISRGGKLMLNSGASATKTSNLGSLTLGNYVNVRSTINSGVIDVNSGALLVLNENMAYGCENVYKGGSSWRTVNYGMQNIYSGGIATTATVLIGGSQNIYSGGLTSNTEVSSGGVQHIRGGRADMTQLLPGGRQFVSSNGLAWSTFVNRGSQHISSGGTANYTSVSHGSQYISVGGKASNTTLYGELKQYSSSITSSFNYTGDYVYWYNSGGSRVMVSKGWTDSVTSSTPIYWFGYTASQSVLSGAKANNTILSSGAIQTVSNGGSASKTTVGASAFQYVLSGGEIFDTVVTSGGIVTVEYDGYGENINVLSGGAIGVHGIVCDLAIDKDADFYFHMAEAVFCGYLDCYITPKSIDAISEIISFSDDLDTLYLRMDYDTDYKGSYTLSEMLPWGFDTEIIIGDFQGEYGKLTVNGNTLIRHGVEFKLTEKNNKLILTVSNDYVEPDFNSDLDGNGKADVILVHTKQGYSGAWLTTGDKSVIKWGSLSDVKAGTEILGTGKLVGSADDGQDIFFTDGKTVGAWNVVEGKVTGYKTIMSVNSTTYVLGLGDFNGDGATDLLLRSASGDLGFYGTDGTGWEYLIGLGKEWKVAAIGDLNGDGLDDTVVRHDAGFAGTFLTQKNGTVKWANLDTLAKDMTIVGTGDFNGDGVDDVLLQNKSNGWVGAWLVEDGSVDSFIGICKNKNNIEQIADFNGDGIDDLRVRAGSDIGVLYVNGADDTTWQYFKSVGKEWDTSFALIS